MLAAVLAVYTQHLHHGLGDWLAMAALIALFTLPSVVAKVRHERWRRRVLSAMR